MRKMKKLVSFLLCGMVTLGVSGLEKVQFPVHATESTATQETLPFADNYFGADFRQGEIAYQLDEAIDVNINTFECCIRMEKNAYTSTDQSVIFGNYNYYNNIASNNRFIDYMITPSGNVRVNWAGTNVYFTSTDVRTGKWVHIGVVRDAVENKFHLYVNGVLTETKDNVIVQDVTGNWFRQRIGGDPRENSRKYPFWGEIGHIACYATTRSSEQVAADYKNVKNVSYATVGDDLLFSAVLALGDNKVYDKSANFNNACIITNDLFYAGELYETQDYSFTAIGDTQKIAHFGTESFNTTTKWIADNATERKIATTMFLGDITDGGASMSDEEWSREWQVAQDAISVLDGKVPYILIPGNHDYLDDSYYRDLTEYNKYFPYSTFADKDYFAGAYEVGQTQNTYYTMTLGGVDYLFLALEFGPDSSVMEWACDVMESHPNHRIVLATHGFLDCAGELFGEEGYLSANWYFSRSGTEATCSKKMWEDYLSKHDNLFMILCGHTVTESIAYKELVGESGNKVMTFRIDPSYIVAGKGLDSIIALFTFNEAKSTLYLNYFSAEKQMLYNVQNQMEINFSTYTRLTDSYYGKGGVLR